MEPGDATRARIVESASACFLRLGVAKTTIDDVAAEVRLSRRTIYRYYANKNELFSAVVSHELEDMSREGRRVYETLPFADAVVEVTLAMSRRVAESPTLSKLFGVDTAGETFEILFGGQEFTALVERFLGPFIRGAQVRGELRRDVDVKDAVEWVTHVVFSLLGPNPVISQHDDDVRILLRTFVVPGLTGIATPAPVVKKAAPKNTATTRSQ
ncbi:TetR/AcrR family transcriptional regulator [Dactylosporangium sp. NPDC005572]|uniref:TetR/AcrR family transcriptional regulator n=1 Tax=Dactylosporangium sp. NPDC005572 TaxID=3156889 RepID=UPI0033B0D0A0